MAKIRAEKHLLDVTQIEGLPEGFEGRVDDLFASWDKPDVSTAAAEEMEEGVEGGTIAEEDTEGTSTLGEGIEGKDGHGHAKDDHHDG